MRFLFRLVMLVVLIAVVLWVFREPVLERLGGSARAAADRVERGARDGLDRPALDLDLDVDRIAAELRETGRVVRRKGGQVVRRLEEATRDGRTTAKIEARFALDPRLKARDIDVDTQDGRVTLSGQVETPEDVARAIRTAMEEENVTEVVSTLRVGGAPAR